MARTSKPMCLNVIPLPIRIGGRSFNSYGITLAFPLHERDVVFSEVDMWNRLSPYLSKISTIDIGARKHRGEWLLAGTTYANSGTESGLKIWQPSVQLGSSCKQFIVRGPRQWIDEKLTSTQPVHQIDMDWKYAWGGPACDQNYLGCGTRRDDEAFIIPPSIELFDNPWLNPDHNYEAVCTLPVSKNHPRYKAYAGTYDIDYLKNYYPGMPADFSSQYFNLASLDQQIEGFWNGDETFELKHWHPSLHSIQGSLPGLRVALHVAKFGSSFERVPCDLTTVWFFPNELMGVLVFHGAVPSSVLDGSDIERLIVGCERLDSPTLTVDHYESLWNSRTDRSTARSAMNALDDTNLCPTGIITRFESLDMILSNFKPNPAFEKLADRMNKQWINAADKIDLLLKENDIANAKKSNHIDANLSQTLTVMKDAFLDYSKLAKNAAPPVLRAPLIDYFNSLEIHKESIQKGTLAVVKKFLDASTALNSDVAQAQEITIQAMKDSMGIIDVNDIKVGLDSLSALMDSMPNDSSAQIEQSKKGVKELKSLIDSFSDDKADGYVRLNETIKAQEAMIKLVTTNYSPFSLKSMPKIDEIDFSQQNSSSKIDEALIQFTEIDDADLRAPTVAIFPGMLLQNKSIVHSRFRDFQMQNVHFTNVEFVRCDFNNVNLTGAILKNCKFIGCDLHGIVFDSSQLDGVNIQWCKASNLSAKGGLFNNCMLMNSMFNSAILTNCSMISSTAVKCSWADALLTHLTLRHVTFLQNDFKCTSLQYASVLQSAWAECNMSEALFNHAKINRCNFYGCKLPSHWTEATLESISFHDAVFNLATSFKNTILKYVIFKSSSIIGANFSGASICDVDFSSAKLQNVDFSKSQLNECIFIGANLNFAIFIDAVLNSCSFGLVENLQSVDFSGSKQISCCFEPIRQDV